MAKQTQLTAIVFALLMATVEIKGGNRYNVVMSRGCRRGGRAIRPSVESPTLHLSPSELSLTPPPVALQSEHSRYELNHRGGGAAQWEVIRGRAHP